MSSRQCDVKECDKPYHGRGYCNLHYKRWCRWGDPLIVKQVQYTDPDESFEARTMPVTETGCLLWTGAAFEFGHGLITVGGRSIGAHRYAWEREYGPIPEGLYVEHLCYTPACCSVGHLRLATRVESTRNQSGLRADNTSGYRGVSWSKKAGKWRVKVKLDGKSRHIGYFTSVEEAADAARAARKELYGEFAGGG